MTWLTNQEIATEFQTSVDRINTLARQGRIPCIDLNPAGKKADRRFVLADVRAALAKEQTVVSLGRHQMRRRRTV